MSPAPPRVRHGTRTGYNAGCRCDACRAAEAAYYQQRRRPGRLRPTGDLTEVGPRLADWRDRGLSWERIGRHAGVSPSTAHSLYDRWQIDPYGRVRLAVAQAIMAADPEPPPANPSTRSVPEHGTAARYRRGCRCQPCRAAAAAYVQTRRVRQSARVEQVGPRLDAWRQQGWSWTALSAELGIAESTLRNIWQRWQTHRGGFVLPRIAAAILPPPPHA